MGRAGPKGVFLRWGGRGGLAFRGAGPEDFRNIKWLFSFVSRLMVRPISVSRFRPNIGSKPGYSSVGSPRGALRFALRPDQDKLSALAPRPNPHRDVRGSAGVRRQK